MNYCYNHKSWGGYSMNRPGTLAGTMNSMPNNLYPAAMPTSIAPTMNQSSGGQSGDAYLNSLIGMQVKVNRGGPESLEGKLIAIQRGYLVLSTKDGTVYINAFHVKSVTEVANSKTSGGRNHQFIVANSFNGVLRQMVKKFAQINWGGPEKIDGFIAEVGNDFLLLVVGGQEFVRIPLSHIKTIKQSGKYASNGSRGGKSGGNKSGGNKSGSHGNKSGSSGNKSGSSGNKSGSHGNKSGSHGNKSGSHGNKSGSGGNKSGSGGSRGNARNTGARTAKPRRTGKKG